MLNLTVFVSRTEYLAT